MAQFAGFNPWIGTAKIRSISSGRVFGPIWSEYSSKQDEIVDNDNYQIFENDRKLSEWKTCPTWDMRDLYDRSEADPNLIGYGSSGIPYHVGTLAISKTTGNKLDIELKRPGRGYEAEIFFVIRDNAGSFLHALRIGNFSRSIMFFNSSIVDVEFTFSDDSELLPAEQICYLLGVGFYDVARIDDIIKYEDGNVKIKNSLSSRRYLNYFDGRYYDYRNYKFTDTIVERALDKTSGATSMSTLDTTGRGYAENLYTKTNNQPLFSWLQEFFDSSAGDIGGGGEPEPPEPAPEPEKENPSAGTDAFSRTPSNSEGRGGQGAYNFDDEINGIEGLPSLSANTSGFITMYNPTPEELSKLAYYFWNDTNLTAALQRAFASPIDSIISLIVLPCDIPNTVQYAVKLGKSIVTDSNGNTLYMRACDSQFIDVDMGTLELQENYGTFHDYAPYTTIHIYIPYCGVFHIDPVDIWGKTVNLTYRIDILTGSCVAFLLVNGSVHYTWSGNCGVQIPFTGQGMSRLMQSIGSIAAMGGVALAGGPVTAGTVAVSALASGVVTQLNDNVSISQGGSISANAGNLDIQRPYLIIDQPNIYKDTNFEKYFGYRSGVRKNLEQFSGFTKISGFRLGGFSGTDEEKKEIERLFEEGIIL